MIPEGTVDQKIGKVEMMTHAHDKRRMKELLPKKNDKSTMGSLPLKFMP